jgi:hypothetical protein
VSRKFLLEHRHPDRARGRSEQLSSGRGHRALCVDSETTWIDDNSTEEGEGGMKVCLKDLCRRAAVGSTTLLQFTRSGSITSQSKVLF